MNRIQAWPHIAYAVDDALTVRHPADAPPNCRLVGWHRGYSPVFVAVWSYLPNVRVDDTAAKDLATDLLSEIGFFDNGSPRDPDYIL